MLDNDLEKERGWNMRPSGRPGEGVIMYVGCKGKGKGNGERKGKCKGKGKGKASQGKGKRMDPIPSVDG